MIESRLQRAPAIIILPPTGNSDQLECRGPRFLPQRPSYLIAAQIRHSNVEKRYIRAKGLRQGQGGATQVHDSHLVACQFEKQGETLRRIAIVICDQYPTTLRRYRHRLRVLSA